MNICRYLEIVTSSTTKGCRRQRDSEDALYCGWQAPSRSGMKPASFNWMSRLLQSYLLNG